LDPGTALSIGERRDVVLRFEQALQVTLVSEARAIGDGGDTFGAIAQEFGGTFKSEVAKVVSETPTGSLLEEDAEAAWAHGGHASDFGLRERGMEMMGDVLEDAAQTSFPFSAYGGGIA